MAEMTIHTQTHTHKYIFQGVGMSRHRRDQICICMELRRGRASENKACTRGTSTGGWAYIFSSSQLYINKWGVLKAVAEIRNSEIPKRNVLVRFFVPNCH